MNLSETKIDIINGAIFEKGGLFGKYTDAIIIPIVAVQNAGIYTKEKIKVDWNWERPILISNETELEVEKDKKVACIVIHFMRDRKS
jgi:hypothetical protein